MLIDNMIYLQVTPAGVVIFRFINIIFGKGSTPGRKVSYISHVGSVAGLAVLGVSLKAGACNLSTA